MIIREERIGDCRLILGNCLEVMPLLGKVDAVVTDPPYGTTGCKWDSVIPLDEMWKAIKKVIEKNSGIVMTASQPFTSTLVCSNLGWFRHEIIWKKNRGSNFASLRYNPFKEHESVLVFGESKTTYNPRMQKRSEAGQSRSNYSFKNSGGGDAVGVIENDGRRNVGLLRHPSSVQPFNTEVGFHPTQKPVELMKYIIETYTNKGDTVLDFTMGSGTTLVACAKLGRKGIGIELDPDYFEIACKRVEEAYRQPDLFVPQPAEPEQTKLEFNNGEET